MSFHSATCSVIVEGPPDKGYWTDGDDVQGYVEIDVQRELSVASVEAQLRCEDRGRAYIQDNRDVVDLSVAHKDVTEILWGSETISFPLGPDRNTLSKGQHRFPFEFKLPENASKLPSSYNVEGNHDFNGTFWGVWAVIDRDQRLRSNYRGFGEIIMYPRRERSFNGNNDSFVSANHRIHLRLHRRPPFMLPEEERTVTVEGRLAVPRGGLIQSRKPLEKEGEILSDIRVAIRSLSHDRNILVKELVIFVDTTIVTTAQGQSSTTTATAIALSTKCEELVRGDVGWVDISHYVAATQIYGLAETFSTNVHQYSHKIRVQVSVALESRPSRASILEVTVPVILHSEVATTNDEIAPPPY